MPAGTVFMMFPAQPKDGESIDLTHDGVILIKEDTVGDDFIIQDLFPWFEGVEDSAQWVDVMVAMLRGETSPPLDYNCTTRDGFLYHEQLFLVWDKVDLERLIGCLCSAAKRSGCLIPGDFPQKEG